MAESIVQIVIIVGCCLLVGLVLIVEWLDFRAQCIEGARDSFRTDGGPAPESGIVIVATEESVEKGRCPVCFTPLDARVKPCWRCRTPHHADCWAYFGGCAIFACEGGDDS